MMPRSGTRGSGAARLAREIAGAALLAGAVAPWAASGAAEPSTVMSRLGEPYCTKEETRPGAVPLAACGSAG